MPKETSHPPLGTSTIRFWLLHNFTLDLNFSARRCPYQDLPSLTTAAHIIDNHSQNYNGSLSDPYGSWVGI
jgi:hypothetical protein